MDPEMDTLAVRVLAQECRLVVAKECMRGSARWDSGSVGFFLTRWLGRGDGAI